MSKFSIVDAFEGISSRMKEEKQTLQEYLSNLTIKVTDEDVDSKVDRLLYNHCVTKTEIRDILQYHGKGVSRPTMNKILLDMEAKGEIEAPLIQSRSMLYNRYDLSVILEHFNIPKYEDDYEPMVIVVQNQKGGTGKTTLVITFAVKMAIDTNTNAKVLVVDMDPQGSCAEYGRINDKDPESVWLTMTDILLRNHVEDSVYYQYKAQTGLSDEELIMEALLPSHLPNLWYLPAFPEDAEFSDIYASLPVEEQAKLLSEFHDVIVPILKTNFNLIVVDTPPSDSPITWAASNAADYFLLPLTPHMLDYSATERFIQYMTVRWKQLPNKGENVKGFKCLTVNTANNKKNVLSKIAKAFRSHLASNYIAKSDLFVSASEMTRSIWDLQKTESINHRYASASEYEKAIGTAQNAYDEVLRELQALSAKN
ncbi:chromosome partitioning protein ParA (plasmid) [Vibrio nigripulchritudo]|uniref:ParA family protein n=1 Tax=Vibrio nigripulchritudo TaxID=28173 RepID=UPI00190C2DC8|nr:ParA family protein [Vibrio nigripulchritudo]BCL73962.1 chromosome partitioning protein ParA [Vibrio nigripulchritudo]BDU35339.1 chromosome partitioning protein ParA [Vibrio nigripulchritudo]